MHIPATNLPKTMANVEVSERIVSGFTGYALLKSGLKNGSILKSLTGGYMLFRAATGYCPVYDLLSKQGVVTKPRNVNIRTEVTVKKSPEEVYAFWRNLENLPLFMSHLESVKEEDHHRSEWKAKLPGGAGSITWRSEIVEDQENERLGWKSIKGSTLENAGTVQFRDAGDFGTTVQVSISYRAPVGKAGEMAARLLNPLFEKTVKEDIENLKWYLERDNRPE